MCAETLYLLLSATIEAGCLTEGEVCLLLGASLKNHRNAHFCSKLFHLLCVNVPMEAVKGVCVK